MLRSIRISNYALIEHLELEFPSGLAIITGQTGAGKSIMLGALSLLTGGRAEQRVISDKAQKSQVEALFDRIPPDVTAYLEERGIDPDPDGRLVIRREISSSGRARIFINDVSVTLQTLSAVTPRIVDIHSQHANSKISDPAARLEIVDAVSDNERLRADYATAFADYVSLLKRIRTLSEQIRKAAENAGYLRFQLAQLDKLRPKRGELVEIEKRYDLLSDADDLRDRLSELSSILGAPDRGVADLLAEARLVADKAGCSQVSGRLEALLLEVKDLCETVEDYRNDVTTDPESLARLSARMNLYYEMVKHFRVKDADELVDLHEDLRRQLAAVETGGDELPALEEKARAQAGELRDMADRISESRRKGAESLAALVTERARPLGLPNIRFTISIDPVKLSATGRDAVTFLCSFNKNGNMMPLETIASGGEISRMMLCLKAVLADQMQIPTVIFDEVDTGVSGEVADKMGDLMRDISRSMQVVAITHLPQVAAKGDVHFKVYKNDEKDRTVTHVRRLDSESRVREIASMMSGSEVSDAALSAARALLGS